MTDIKTLVSVPRKETSMNSSNTWYLGSMNDGLFIINTPPSPSGTDVPPGDYGRGPSMVLNVTDLPHAKAKAIVEAHNSSLSPSREAGEARPDDDTAIRYALRYGGMCRDCADTRIDGICDHSGMPCSPDVCRKVMAHALSAWRYGIGHGFMHNPLALPASSSEVSTLKAEVERLRKALEKIERWFGEFPETGRFWKNDDGSTSDRPMSYGAAFGSNGERDFMRSVARAALHEVEEG